MNPFSAIGLGQAMGRGVGRRHMEARARLVHDIMAQIESEAMGPHPADASADLCIARLRAAATTTKRVSRRRQPGRGAHSLAYIGD